MCFLKSRKPTKKNRKKSNILLTIFCLNTINRMLNDRDKELLIQEARENILSKVLEFLNGEDPTVKEAEDGSRGVLLADLGGCIQWNVRYKPELGKLGQFIQSDEMLQSTVRTLRFQDHPQHTLVRFRSDGLAANYIEEDATLLPTDIVRDAVPNEFNGAVLTLQRGEVLAMQGTIAGAAEPQSPHYPNLNQRALARMQAILESAHDAHPPLSAKSSTLAILLNWAAEFKDILGPFEAWVRTRGGPIFRLHLIGPGLNFVSFQPGGDRTEVEVEEDTFRLRLPTYHPAPLQPPPRPPTPPLSPLQVLGVLPGDFFNIPIGADVGMAERSYRRGCQQFFDLLASLAAEGLLRDSLSYGSQPFEMLEWYGDAVLHLELSTMLVDSLGAFGGPDVLSVTRQNGEQNLTLALIFDEIGLARLLTRCPPSWSGDRWKAKGDIVEAIIGELADKLRKPDGIPSGHPRRNAAERVIRMFAQCLNTRGQAIKSEHQRRALEQAAQAPGGGGLRATQLDAQATSRCSR